MIRSDLVTGRQVPRVTRKLFDAEQLRAQWRLIVVVTRLARHPRLPALRKFRHVFLPLQPLFQPLPSGEVGPVDCWIRAVRETGIADTTGAGLALTSPAFSPQLGRIQISTGTARKVGSFADNDALSPEKVYGVLFPSGASASEAPGHARARLRKGASPQSPHLPKIAQEECGRDQSGLPVSAGLDFGPV